MAFTVEAAGMVRDEDAERFAMTYIGDGGVAFWFECVALPQDPTGQSYAVMVDAIGKAARHTLRHIAFDDATYREVVTNIDRHLREKGLDIGAYVGRLPTDVGFSEQRAAAVAAATRGGSVSC